MKRIAIAAFALLIISACKNTSEEVKSDETIIENPADTIAVKDTVALVPPTDVKAAEIAVVDPKIEELAKEEKIAYANFGTKFSPDKVLSKEQMLKKYKSLKAGDTVAVKFASQIKEVCKKKGCWMSMDLSNEKESFVRFKDYGFFVPLNADKSDAIVSGRAFLDVISVSQLQHYAKDGGKSQDEIDKITEPKITYAFQADGVLIKE